MNLIAVAFNLAGCNGDWFEKKKEASPEEIVASLKKRLAETTGFRVIQTDGSGLNRPQPGFYTLWTHARPVFVLSENFSPANVSYVAAIDMQQKCRSDSSGQESIPVVRIKDFSVLQTIDSAKTFLGKKDSPTYSYECVSAYRLVGGHYDPDLKTIVVD